MVRLEAAAGVKFNAIPFNGSAQQKAALASKTLDIAFLSASEVPDPENEATPVRLLAQFTKNKVQRLGSVPTTYELGLPVEMTGERGFAAPNDLPPAVLGRLEKAIEAAMKDPEFVKAARNDAPFLSFLGGAEWTPPHRAGAQDLRRDRALAGQGMNERTMSAHLSHLRVLDLSRVLAGPWASQNLADLGAEVIKIERPGRGDDTRAWGPPFLKDEAGAQTSETAYFLCANRGKKSLTLDIASARGQEIVRALAARSDVLIENFKTGDLRRYGLAYDDLKAVNPELVYCSITGFGQDGPFSDQAGYDFMIQGTGGLMSITGEPDSAPGGGPKKVGVPVADLMTGMYATVAILAALARRDRGGGGEHIDMALLDCQVAMLSNLGQNYLISGHGAAALGQRASERGALPGLSHRRRPRHHRHRQRPPVRASSARPRASRRWPATRASSPTPTG